MGCHELRSPLEKGVPQSFWPHLPGRRREAIPHTLGRDQKPKRYQEDEHETSGRAVRQSEYRSADRRQNQELRLRQIAERRGWDVVEVYNDAGISGAKDRKQRPGLDRMLNDASRRHFDVVMAWAIDRVGRSLIDLLGTSQHLEACGVDLYLDQQAIDTTTPMGKLIFQITGAFAEFERAMIRQRVHAGLARARKNGKVLGRARIDPAIEADIRAAHAG
jgi:DNA invertase Pin-like site-specific DNA recombinase